VACIAKSNISSMSGLPKSGHGWAIYEYGLFAIGDSD
jgi:hypothetical protein